VWLAATVAVKNCLLYMFNG